MTQKTSLTTDLVQFYDDYCEFNDYCVFLCDAIASISAEEDGLEPDTASGVARYSQWVKSRALTLKRDIRQIQQKSKDA